MPQSVIILAGVAYSGKSRTLREIATHKNAIKDRRVYLLEDKNVCVFFSSPQELNNRFFCKYNLVIAQIDRMIETCDTHGCPLLIMAFTIYTKRGKLNVDCITKPLEHIQRLVPNVHLFYLRKGSSLHIQDIDALVLGLKPEKVIPSDKDYQRQASELLPAIKADP